mmetsp:Transcript_14086/g.13694  ORF Transcript_14086/g.13694 Transcript_14086/m.13694 type:complete len:113 (-) Transcript_14086:851-1189(-)
MVGSDLLGGLHLLNLRRVVLQVRVLLHSVVIQIVLIHLVIEGLPIVGRFPIFLQVLLDDLGLAFVGVELVRDLLALIRLMRLIVISLRNHLLHNHRLMPSLVVCKAFIFMMD